MNLICVSVLVSTFVFSFVSFLSIPHPRLCVIFATSSFSGRLSHLHLETSFSITYRFLLPFLFLFFFCRLGPDAIFNLPLEHTRTCFVIFFLTLLWRALISFVVYSFLLSLPWMFEKDCLSMLHSIWAHKTDARAVYCLFSIFFKFLYFFSISFKFFDGKFISVAGKWIALSASWHMFFSVSKNICFPLIRIPDGRTCMERRIIILEIMISRHRVQKRLLSLKFTHNRCPAIIGRSWNTPTIRAHSNCLEVFATYL